jgi:hypothetical protein
MKALKSHYEGGLATYKAPPLKPGTRWKKGEKQKVDDWYSDKATEKRYAQSMTHRYDVLDTIEGISMPLHDPSLDPLLEEDSISVNQSISNLAMGITFDRRTESPFSDRNIQSGSKFASLFMGLSESTGPGVCAVRDSSNLEIGVMANIISGSSSMKAAQAQTILDAMPPSHQNAAADRSHVQIYAGRLVCDMADQRRRAALLKKMNLPPSLGFEADRTIALANELFKPAIDNLNRPWKSQDRSAIDKIEAMQKSLMALRRKTDTPREQIRLTLLSHRRRNAGGEALLVAPIRDANAYPAISFTVRALYELARTDIALTVYKLKHGDYPSSLADLVKDKILKGVPVDPFSDKPILYQRNVFIAPITMLGGTKFQKLPAIWSVGMNGVDDHHNGTAPPGSNFHYDHVVIVGSNVWMP